MDRYASLIKVHDFQIRVYYTFPPGPAEVGLDPFWNGPPSRIGLLIYTSL